MSRLFFMTFHGKRRWVTEGEDAVHPHESPLTMTVPMMVLAVGSAALGLVLAYVFPIAEWLEPTLGRHEHHEPVLPIPVLMAATLVVVAVGAVWAFLVYGRQEVPEVAPTGSALTRAARHDLYQDELNETLVMWPGIRLTRGLVETDRDIVDGAVAGLSGSLARSANGLRRVQNGFARSYALTMLAGVVAFLGALWVIN